MLIDAIVLAGGRSSRLDSVAKAELRYRQQPLVERTASGTRRVVVVGPVRPESLPERVLLACDMPNVGPAVPALHEALSATHPRTG